MRTKVASGVGYGAIGGATSALIAPYVVSAAGGAQNLTDGQRAAIAGMSTLLGGLTAGLTGQNAQGGAAAAENEVLNNSLGDHRTEAQKEQDEQKEELSQERAKLSGGQEIIGYDAEGNPEYAVKPPPSLFGLAGSTGTSQGGSGKAAGLTGLGSGIDLGAGASDWNDGASNAGQTLENLGYTANGISHIFKDKHLLDPLVSQFGSQENALLAMQSAAQQAVSAGTYQTGAWVSIQVGGVPVAVKGAFVNGTFRISTATKRPF